jgi:methionyl-tRNA synthetase
MKLCTTYLFDGYRPEPAEFPDEYTQAMQKYDVKSAFEYIFKLVSDLDNYIQNEQPFKVVKVDEERGKAMLHNMRTQLYMVGRLLQPFMPCTSDIIKGLIKHNQMPERPIFPRYE